MDGSGVEYVAECFWPGVGEAELGALDERARASADALVEQGRPVRYLGSLLMRTDEVVLCLFAGEADAVRAAAEQAHVPFERIVVAERSSWSEPEGRVAPRRSRPSAHQPKEEPS